jgi:cell division transport system permease protein
MRIEALHHFYRSWKTHSVVQTTTLLVLTSTFFIVTLFLSVYENLDQLLTQWGADVQMTAFLDDNIDLKDLNAISEKVGASDFVEKISYVSKEQAVETFLSQMGSFAPDLIKDKNFSNPLPASFEIQLSENMGKASSYDRLVELAQFVKTLPGVDDVSYGQGWIENYSSLVTQFGKTSGTVIIILLAGCLLIVGNSVRNSIYARRDEIEVLELVGATASRIQSPFIIEGAMMGLISSVLALVLGSVFFAWQSQSIFSELSFLGLQGKTQFLSIVQVLLFPVFGATVGALGAYLCVRRLSTGWSAAERIEQC